MKYQTIYADPPYKYGKGWGWGAGEYYKLMSFDDIASLPISEIATPNSHLYLWSPNSIVPKALLIMESWGFTYKTLITWFKNRSIFGYYFKGHTEQLLFGVRGSLPVNDRRLTTKLEANSIKHSQKPSAAYELIERASPPPRLELFARQKRDGWHCWGNEVESDIEL